MNKTTDYPKFTQIKQKFSLHKVKDINKTIKSELTKLKLHDRIKSGNTVAVTAGSRGITEIKTITRIIIDELIKLGGKPFIIPAMGSHGGATAKGQINVLTGYGITEETMGVPIKSSMGVTRIGESREGIPVYADKNALTADHIVVINRVKSHTRFIGKVESGLIKMLMVGLGKDTGAKIYHRAIMKYSFDQITASVLPVIQSKLPVLFGLAIIENAFGEVAEIQAVPGEDFINVEPKLKNYSFEMMAKLPFRDIDLLIVDEMGKDISGTGMDTNVIGRRDESLIEDIRIARIFVRDLTPQSHGNACGIGLADFTTKKLVDKIMTKETYINCLTALRPEGAKIPMTFNCDKDAFAAAISTCGVDDPQKTRIVWVKNTLNLEKAIVSEAFLDEIKGSENLDQISPVKELVFDCSGNLPLFDEWTPR
ncbi:MAG: lactate racemase domain-containing protein [Candidatus Scalindua sp.]|nr:lactate racemase domain-containing protein [Candidatus Scalindua sp.]